jgi:hypothetical protein
MSVVDDHGRFHALPKLLRAACYPLQIDKVSDADIGKWTAECVEAALVSVYPASDGKRYIQIEKFGQRVQARSKFPDPSGEISVDSGTHNISPWSTVKNRLVGDVVEDEDEGDKRTRPAPVDLFPDVTEQTVKDFKALRKAKKAPITETAMDGIKREAAKAGYTLEQALRTICERGWTGFKADWVANAPGPMRPSNGTVRTRRELA